MNYKFFVECENYYLFLDECGTAEMNDVQDPIFLLCCVKVEKHYYDKHFRKQVLSFKKNHKISSNVLHSTDIRKTRAKFSFLLNPIKRKKFFEDLSTLIDSLDFEIFYFYVEKKHIEIEGFDIYWHSLQQVLLMIKNNLRKTNVISNVFCESRNSNQNNKLANAYNSYYQELSLERKFRICFPKNVEFRPKDASLYEMSGLEITDLVAFPIFNKLRNRYLNQESNINLIKNYKLVKKKVCKCYGYAHNTNHVIFPIKKPPTE